MAVAVLLVLSAVSLLPAAAGTAARPGTRASSPPITIVLQPDGANGTDTFVVDATPLWNFGDNMSIRVGPDASAGSVSRGLLGFDLSSVPAGATIVNASLDLYQAAGGAGIVEARRATAPWTEGSGERSWTRVPLTVRETAGVPRVREPVGVFIPFAPGSIVDPARDLRVLDSGVEVPSQVYGYTYSGSDVTGAWLWFGATVPALGSRTFTVTYSTNGTSMPGYRTKGIGPTALWTSPPVGTGASGATVADVDGDGRLEVVYGTSDGYVYNLDANGTPRWWTRLSTTNSVPYTPQVADLDRDGGMDIVVITNDPALVRLNATGGVVWTAAMAVPDLPISTPTLIDVNGDGVLDVLLGRRTKAVDAFSGADGMLIQTFKAADWTYTASVLDLDRDGIGEVFFASDDKKVHAYDVSAKQLWANAPGNASFLENSVAIGDVDGDGFPDVVTGDDLNVGQEFALNATDGSVLWSMTLPSYREGGQTIADLDSDGAVEVIVPLYDGTLRVLRGRDGADVWTFPAGTGQGVAPAVVDVTNDGSPEILYMDKDTAVRVLNATGALIHSWTIPANDPGLRTLTQRPLATPAIADVDGDGTLEVIVPTGSGVQAFATGGLSRDWRTFGYNWNHTHRAGDGTSPDGAPFLETILGSPAVVPGGGASWDFRDGATTWAARGGDFGAPEASVPAGAGWNAWNVTGMVRDWHLRTYPNVGLFLTEADEAAGATHEYLSSDSPNASLRPRLTVTYVTPIVSPVPRIVGTIPDMTRAEDSPPWTIDLASFAEDEDTAMDELRWNITGTDPQKIGITGLNVPGNHVLTLYPQKDANGDMRVTYWLTDPDGNFARQDAWIRLTPVNDAPSFSPPATFVVRFNQTYTFDFGPYISDVDDAMPDLRLSSDDPVQAAVSGFNVSFLYPASLLNQWVFVVLTVTDGVASAAKVVAVKVTSDNPPVLSRPLPDITMMEGEFIAGVFDLDDHFADADNDALFFSFGYSHLNITIQANHSVDIRAQSDWSGWERVTFRGEDPSGAIAEDSIIVTVLPVNDPPALGPVPDLRVRYDEPYLFNLEPYMSDPDTPLDQLNCSTSSPYISVSLHLLTILYPFAFNNTVQTVILWVSDGATTVNRAIRITVGDDRPPRLLSKLPDQALLEDTERRGAYNLSSFFDDPDSAQLFWSSGNESVLIAIDPWGSVDLRGLPDWFGTERVTFRATDSLGALAEDAVWITVLPVNDAPSFRAVPGITLNVTTSYLDLTPYLTDVDNETSDLVLSSADPRATVVGHGVLLRFDADASASVEVVVSDGLLTNRTAISVVVALPRVPGEIPGWLYWLPVVVAVAGFSVLVVYRRRQLEWAFLVTNDGLLVASMFRKATANLDSDLLTGMLTVIMNFTRVSFSDETERQLEGLEMGDRRVAIVRGDLGYLAVVYKGRTPGSLTHVMRGLLTSIEARHPDLFGTIVDSSKAEGIPVLLQKLLRYGWWPFLTFPEVEGAHTST